MEDKKTLDLLAKREIQPTAIRIHNPTAYKVPVDSSDKIQPSLTPLYF